MEKSSSVRVNMIRRRPVDEAYVLVLVEDGPWPESKVLDGLQKVQTRLMQTVDAVLDGSFARRFPESKGKHFVIRLNSYNIENEELDILFTRFTSWIKKSERVERGIKDSGTIRSLHFEYNKY